MLGRIETDGAATESERDEQRNSDGVQSPGPGYFSMTCGRFQFLPLDISNLSCRMFSVRRIVVRVKV